MGMRSPAVALLATLFLAAVPTEARSLMSKEKEKICDAGWECSGSKYCCNETIFKFFQVYQFEQLFPKRNDDLLAHAQHFWDYHFFITASSFSSPSASVPLVRAKKMQMKEVAAFLGHVGAKTTYQF